MEGLQLAILPLTSSGYAQIDTVQLREFLQTERLTLKKSDQNKFQAIYFLPDKGCDICEAESRIGWQSAATPVKQRTIIRFLCVDVSGRMCPPQQLIAGAEALKPFTHLPSSPLLNSLRGKCIILNHLDQIIAIYRIGSEHGFERAYRKVDSILWNENLNSKLLAPRSIHTAVLNHAVTRSLRIQIFVWPNEKFIELFDADAGNAWLIDTEGEVLAESAQKQRGETSLQLQQAHLFLGDSNSFRGIVTYSEPYDTVFFNHRARAYRQSQEELIFTTNGRARADIVRPSEWITVASADNSHNHIWTGTILHGADTGRVEFQEYSANGSLLGKVKIRSPFTPGNMILSFQPRDTLVQIVGDNGKLWNVGVSGSCSGIQLSYSPFRQLYHAWIDSSGEINYTSVQAGATFATTYDRIGLRDKPLYRVPNESYNFFMGQKLLSIYVNPLNRSEIRIEKRILPN